MDYYTRGEQAVAAALEALATEQVVVLVDRATTGRCEALAQAAAEELSQQSLYQALTTMKEHARAATRGRVRIF